MSDSQPSVPDFLREEFARINGKLDRLSDDMREVKHRITSLERQIAILHGDFANQSSRIDRIEARLDRIERRLDLVQTP